MAFDGIVTHTIVNELKEKLLGGRVDRVYQPLDDELAITIHCKGKNQKLLISANNSNPRIHLSDYDKKNPQQPPMFCMLLRKHIQGGIVLNIEQYHMDRIIFIDISSLDELGLEKEIRLVVEIMGRHSNIILVDKESNTILDSINRITEDISRVRQILPGLPYTFPPLQDKALPLDTNREEFLELLDKEKDNTQVFRFLYFNYMGLSPLIGREICFRANIDTHKHISELDNIDKEELYREFNNIMTDIKNNNLNPMFVKDESDKILAFYCISLKQYGDGFIKESDSISKIIDIAFYKKDNHNRIHQQAANIRRTVQTILERSENKLAKQKEEYLTSKDRDIYKIYADLLSANFHRIPNNKDSVIVENFYDENMKEIEIPLNIKMTPPQNADRYYKRYSRLKNAERLLKRRIPYTRHEILYLENVLVNIDNATHIDDLEEIKEELIREKYIEDTDNKKNRKKKNNISKPHHYISSDNFNIYVGKNNRQNDQLTLRTSNRHDIWLHVQKMPGSHVIIQKDSPDIKVPESTLQEAAILAAYYSKARNGKNIPVDYTERLNVRKARGAKPGMVFYDNFQTLFVNPAANIVANIDKKE